MARHPNVTESSTDVLYFGVIKFSMYVEFQWTTIDDSYATITRDWGKYKGGQIVNLTIYPQTGSVWIDGEKVMMVPI